MRKRLIALCLTVILISMFFTPEFPKASVGAKEDLLISDCETLENWTRLPAGASLGINSVGRTGKALGIDTTNGTLRGICFASPSPIDISGYTKVEWDMFFCKAGDPTIDTWPNIADSTIYKSLIGAELSSSSGGYHVYKLDKIKVTAIEGAPGWYHMSVTIDDATSKNGTLNKKEITGFKFYTNPSAGVDTAVPNTLMKLDNLYATGKVSEEPTPDTVLISDCEGVNGSKTEDAFGNWSRLPVGQPIEFQPDTLMGTGSAITVTATSGTLRQLAYNLKAPVDTTKYTRLEWDMRVFKEGDGSFSTWEDICSKYGPVIGARIGSSDSDYYSYDLSKMTVTPIEGKPTCYHVSVEIEDTALRTGSFDRSRMTFFSFYTNPAPGAPVGTVNSVLRIDNLIITRNTGDDGDEEDPPAGGTFTWDIGSGTYHKADAGNIHYEIKGFNIDASAASFDDLVLTLSIYVENLDEPGNLSGFTRNNSEGQIELTSSGGPDAKEYNWSLPKQGLKPGWNHLRLPLKYATAVGGGADISSLNYFRLYNLVPIGNTTRFEVIIKDVKLTNAQEKLHVPSFFADGMLFQQNKPMNIWGRTENPDVSVSVELYKDSQLIEEKTTRSDDEGDWKLSLTARKGSYDTYSIVIKENGVEVKRLDDVLIGELWLAAGQSNMEFPVYQIVGGNDLVSAARDKYLRFMMEPSVPAGRNENQPYNPQYDVPGTRWGYGNVAGDVSNVSAVAYVMALELRKELDVPVGFINSALGATVIETWMSRESIDNDPIVKQELVNRGLYKTEQTFNTGADKWNQMTAMYNAKIAPLKGMNIAGVLWYQGESNAKYAYGYYEAALTALVKDWSSLFGFAEGEMPFIFAHLAPHNYTKNMPFDYLAYFSEMLSKVWVSQPGKMAQITLYDLPLKYSDPPVGGAHPIHPSDKAPVGKRFANAALSLVYGKVAEGYTAPVYKSMQVVGNKIIVTFAETGSGLSINGDSNDLHGFAICGPDRVFVGAKAKIISPNTVEVWSEGIQNPVAVTYGFSTFNMAANLINSFGLPAVPFRSDTVESNYYCPNDWTYCDSDKIWVSIVDPLGAGYEPMWVNAPISGTGNAQLEFDSLVKLEGAAALKVTYVPEADGLIGIGPVLNYPTMENKPASYNYLTVYVNNPDSRAKKLELIFRTSDGKLYKATTANSESNTAYRIKAGEGFALYVFDLAVLVDEQGNRVSDSRSVLNHVEDMQFTITDKEGGSVYLDDIQFAMDAVSTDAENWSEDGDSGDHDDDDGPENPKTGDSFGIALFALLAGLSGVTSVYAKKRSKANIG